MATHTSQIDSLVDQWRVNLRQAEQIFSSHTTGQLQHNPVQRRWSAAECIAHLNFSNRAYLPLLDSAIQQLLEEKLNSARGLALDRVKISSPFATNMEYSAYSAFVLIPAHNRRHLWQAEPALRS
jgi:hypothetical protein